MRPKSKVSKKSFLRKIVSLAKLEARGIDLTSSEDALGHRGPDVPLNARIIAVRPEVNVVILSDWFK